ncbi:MAG TPA: GAF domain-containing protein [Candidatus Baltobacteraceae bacterium]|nr:GAF domain-containing protein [Candidatus Baltobacteraceae bacterium]
MKPAVWRSAALALIAAAIGFALYQPFLRQQDDFGITFVVPREHPGDIVVTSVEPNSQAAHAGIHIGDRIAYGQTALQRAQVAYALPGAHVSLLVNDSKRVVLTARTMPPVGDWNATVLRLAFLLVAALLAWRRPEDRATRWLVFFLWCYGLAIGLANGLLPAPLLSFIFLRMLAGVLFLLGTGAVAGFAANFPAPVRGDAPRIMAFAAQAIAVFFACAITVVEWLPRTGTAVSLLNAGVVAAFAAIALLVVATFVTTYLQGAPTERQRRRWVFLIVGFGLFGLVTDILVSMIAGYQAWLDMLALIPLALLPIGLAYVILRHRVIDVGFVLNRAVVYTGVSLIVVGIFVILETLLGKYVESTSHVTSIAVQLAVALVLGFSIRYVHERVDRFVDSVLFRERHLAEAAIREFSHDAGYITDTGVLLTRTVQVVERYTHTHGAGVWLAAGAHYRPGANTFAIAPEVTENDPAVVAMRARRVSVHVRDCGSALPGFLAFPMIVRGELLGILVCGQKLDDETFAPDEEAALASLATSVGHALDAIEVRELRRRLEALTATGGVPRAF